MSSALCKKLIKKKPRAYSYTCDENIVSSMVYIYIYSVQLLEFFILNLSTKHALAYFRQSSEF